MAIKNKELVWHYEGRSKSGEIVTGTIEATTAVIARVKLRKLAIEPLVVKVKSKWSFLTLSLGGDDKHSSVSKNERKLGDFVKSVRPDEIHALSYGQSNRDSEDKKKVKRKIKDKEITVFIKQFTVVIRSGVPLLRAFDIVINGVENKNFYQVLSDIKFGVENGLSLYESFSAYPKVFDPLFINFLAIGEQGGILESLLERYIEYKEKSDAVRRRVKSAMAYPIIVLVVACLVLSVILGFVVPQFQAVFESVNATLPAPTLIVIALSHAVIDYWWLGILMIVGLIIGIKYMYRNIPNFRFFMDSFVFRVPLFGDLTQKTLISRWTRTLSLLFAAGVPLNNALRSIAFLVDNYLYGVATLNIQHDVESGISLSQSMESTGVFPAMVNQMVAVGEEAGSLESLLKSIADYYDQELEMVIETILSLIEPLTIVFLGVILGAIIVAIYLPLFHLGDVVG